MPDNSNAAATTSSPSRLGENKGIQFEIRTGNSRWICTLQERSTYERRKQRNGSSDSINSSASSASITSSDSGSSSSSNSSGSGSKSSQ